MGKKKTSTSPVEPNKSFDLGNKIAHYPVVHHQSKHLVWLLLSVIFIAAIIFLLIYAGFDTWVNVNTHGRAIMLNQARYFLIAVFILLPMGILSLFLSKTFKQKGITIYQNGLVLNTGVKKHELAWHEIDTLDTVLKNIIFGNSTVSVKVLVRIMTEQGQNFKFHDQYERLEQLIDYLRQYLLPILFQKAANKLDGGGRIKFHPSIVAIKSGIKFNNNYYSWQDIRTPEIKRGRILFRTDDLQQKNYRFNPASVRNLDVLLHLIKTRVTAQ